VTSLQANQNPFATELPFKEGIVHYTITGSQTGTQTTYIKDYGKQRLIYRKSYDRIMHEDNLHETLIMITPQWTYRLNLQTKIATKESNLQTLLKEEFEHLAEYEQAYILTKSKSLRLGFACIPLSIDGTIIEVTKDGYLPLFSKTDILGYSVRTQATKIEIKALDKKVIALPQDIKILEQEADFEEVTHILQSLLD
jgi:hypothetical protein